MKYTVLDEAAIPSYLADLRRPMEVLDRPKKLDITEIGDGNLNYVYRVATAAETSTNSKRKNSLILKQAVPYLRVEGESWPLSRSRMVFETRALKLYNELVPRFVPEIYHTDEEMSVLVMEDLGNVKVMRYLMLDGVVLPKVGKDIGEFLGITLFKTSYLEMDSVSRRRLMQAFNLNDELCKLTEEFVFTFPFIKHPSNYQNQPSNEHALKVFRGNPEYINRVLEMKELFLSKADALIHGDLHTGSLMAGPEETYVIDTEFAFFGPFGFDVGKIIANFLMSYTSHFYRPGGPKYQKWILDECVNIWDNFEKKFLELWSSKSNSALYIEGMLEPDRLENYKSQFMRGIFRDAIGFCACSLARRTIGLAGVADIRSIEDKSIRTRLEIMNIDLSHHLMMKTDEIHDVNHFAAVVEDFYNHQKL